MVFFYFYLFILWHFIQVYYMFGLLSHTPIIISHLLPLWLNSFLPVRPSLTFTCFVHVFVWDVRNLVRMTYMSMSERFVLFCFKLSMSNLSEATPLKKRLPLSQQPILANSTSQGGSGPHESLPASMMKCQWVPFCTRLKLVRTASMNSWAQQPHHV